MPKSSKRRTARRKTPSRRQKIMRKSTQKEGRRKTSSRRSSQRSSRRSSRKPLSKLGFEVDNDGMAVCNSRNTEKLRKMLKIDYRKHCQGLVQPNGKTVTYPKIDLMEMNDLVCVISRKKTIAVINTLKGGFKNSKYKQLIKEMIEMADDCEIDYISDYDKKLDIYRIIAYQPKYLEQAMLLMYSLTAIRQYVSDYAIGKLLDYADPNIKGFYKMLKKQEEFNEDKRNYSSLISQIKRSYEFEKYKIKFQNTIRPISEIGNIIF